MGRGLLTHLADRFVSQREDLATEALLYVLKESEAARQSLVMLANDLGCEMAGQATFRSQATGDDGERPDLVGVIDGREQILLEAKFWAGLTDNQPVAYLERLSRAGSGALVFVAPEKRLEILWIELERRVLEAGLAIGARLNVGPAVYAANAGVTRLAVTSWRNLLSRIELSLAASGESELIESLRQLEELCKREDTRAFLPLTGEELTSNFPRRLKQFGTLVDDAVARLVHEDDRVSTDGLRSAAGNGWYGRYVWLSGAGCLVHVSGRKWADVESTPIWIRIKDKNWEVSPALRKAFEESQAIGTLRFVDRGDGLEIPIRLPLGQDRSVVLEHMLDQMRSALEVLSRADLPEKR